MGDMLTVYRDERDAAEAHVKELKRERDAALARVAELERANKLLASDHLRGADILDALEARCDALREALEQAQQALNTWVATYAGEMCSDEHVEEAWQRIADGGGTLAYIADVSAHIRAALQPSPAGEE